MVEALFQGSTDLDRLKRHTRNTRHMIEQGTQHVTPYWVAQPAYGLQWRHAVRLRQGDTVRRRAWRRKSGHRVLLRIGQMGHKKQVLRDGTNLSQLPQAGRPSAEYRGQLWHSESRNGSMVKRFDVTARKNSLQSIPLKSMAALRRAQTAAMQCCWL